MPHFSVVIHPPSTESLQRNLPQPSSTGKMGCIYTALLACLLASLPQPSMLPWPQTVCRDATGAPQYDRLRTSSVAFTELPKPLTHPQDNTALAKPLHNQTAPCPATDTASPLKSHVTQCTSARGPRQDLAPEVSPTCYSPCHQAPGLPPPTQSPGSTSRHSEPEWAQNRTHGPDTILSRTRLSLLFLLVSAKPSPSTLESQGAAGRLAHLVLSPTQAGIGCPVREWTSWHMVRAMRTPQAMQLISWGQRRRHLLIRIHKVTLVLAYLFTSCDTPDLYHRPPAHTSLWLATNI